jgi:hypothetical protein
MNSGKFSSQLHIVGLSWEPHAKFASQRNVCENIMQSKGTESTQDIKHTPAVTAAQQELNATQQELNSTQQELNATATSPNFCFVALSCTLDDSETSGGNAS